ncbi:glycosyl transferase family 2, partial [mine drainage metagenome]
DEFVFPPNESPHDFLNRQSCDVVRSCMFQVYRHRNDKNLDPSLAPIPQRIHGDPDLFSTDTQANRAANSVYIKPNIVRPSKRICFLPGHHQIEGNPQASPESYVGAHWQMADPSIAIARRMERKARVSERNRARQMGWQHFDITVDKIKEECERHLDDPVIDALSSFTEIAVQNLPSMGLNGKSEGKDSPASDIIGRVFHIGDMHKFDLLQHQICLLPPRRTVPFMSWRQHVPFAMLLVDFLKPRTLVELGVHYGDSYCAFCQAVAELRLGTSCYGVDTWKGDPHASFYGPEVLADLAAHHDPLYGSFSHLIQSTFDEAVQHFPD